MAAPDADGNVPHVVITEIGGTVGDIESLPFLEAARQVRHDVGRDNCFFLHVSLVPYLAPSGELKTKPTQHSVAALRSIGITPGRDRLPRRPRAARRAQAQDLADVRRRRRGGRRRGRRAEHLRDPEGAARRGPRRLRRAPARPAVPRRRLDGVGRPARPGAPPARTRSPSRWSASTSTCPTPTCRSPRRCAPAAFAHRAQVHDPLGRLRRLRDAGRRGRRAGRRRRRSSIPGGFGIRGIEGKVGALRYARERGIPTLGLCLGLQCMVIEAARNLAGLEGANSAEFDPDTPHPVIATMADQVAIVAGEADLGGTMRLGAYPADAHARLGRGRGLRQRPSVSERHRHRYEVNNAYRDQLEAGRPGHLRHLAGRPAGRVRRAARATSTRSSSARRRTRSSSRARPGPPAVPRASSPPRSTTATRSGCRSQIPTTTTSRRRRRRARQRRRPSRRRRRRDRRPSSPVVDSTTLFEGRVVASASTTSCGCRDGSRGQREIVEHPGAVAVVALDDDEQRRARPPVPASRCVRWLDELPAGLLDVDGEPPLDAAPARARRGGAAAADDVARAARPAHLAGLLRRGGPGLPRPRPATRAAAGRRSSSSTRRSTHDGDAGCRSPRRSRARSPARSPTRPRSPGCSPPAAARANGWRGLRPADAPWPARPGER